MSKGVMVCKYCGKECFLDDKFIKRKGQPTIWFHQKCFKAHYKRPKMTGSVEIDK